jgi:peroxiredoxin Q/BCP
MRFSRLVQAVALGALSLAGIARAADAPAVGSPAPSFTLNSQEGKPVSLGDFRGKWVVLYFYPKDFTSGCTLEAHNFQRDLPQYQQKNAVILGVSVDSTDSHQKFCTKEGLNFKLLSDPQHQVSDQYGSVMTYHDMTLSERHTFLIDPQGVIRKTWMDVDSDVGKHSRDVLAAIAELQQAPASK